MRECVCVCVCIDPTFFMIGIYLYLESSVRSYVVYIALFTVQ